MFSSPQLAPHSSLPSTMATIAEQVLTHPTIRADIVRAVASDAQRPLICVLLLQNVVYLEDHPSSVDSSMRVDFECVKDASRKQQLFQLVPSLERLAGLKSPAPVLVRFEITYTNGARVMGVFPHYSCQCTQLTSAHAQTLHASAATLAFAHAIPLVCCSD